MFLLLIACVNLSNLFGARASTRSGELAVRLALGASRLRLTAQSVAEAAPVLVMGGILGIVAAQGAVGAFVAAAPASMPRIESIELNVRVIVFAFILLVLTGVAASVVPAAKAWTSDFTSITKDGGRGATSGRRRSAARRIGVAMQIAFALPLIVGASLLIRSAINVARVELGFRPERVATFAFGVSRTTYQTDDAIADYYSRLVDAVRSVPGVATAAIGNRIPLTGAQTNPVRFETPSGRTDEETNVDTRTVTPDYFATLGIPLVSGRTFTDRDDRTAPPVGIVDDRVAQTMWPGQSALGKRFRGPDGAWRTIIGVVGHVRTAGLEEDPRPQVYWSHRQWTQYRGTLAVRAQLAPQTLYTSAIKAIRSVDANQPVYDVQTMEDVVDSSLAQRRVTTVLMVGFGAAALLLAAVGIYGVVAYGVTQRLREFGIRVALGATPGGVTRLVVWQATSMAMAGAVIGVALAIAAAGTMSNLVFGVAPRDLASILAATTLLVVVAALASYLPARRAAGVDPGSTLRSE
jgi:putative ABC transport system permease protein